MVRVKIRAETFCAAVNSIIPQGYDFVISSQLPVLEEERVLSVSLCNYQLTLSRFSRNIDELGVGRFLHCGLTSFVFHRIIKIESNP